MLIALTDSVNRLLHKVRALCRKKEIIIFPMLNLLIFVVNGKQFMNLYYTYLIL